MQMIVVLKILQKLIFVTYYSITIFAFDYQGQFQWLN